LLQIVSVLPVYADDAVTVEGHKNCLYGVSSYQFRFSPSTSIIAGTEILSTVLVKTRNFMDVTPYSVVNLPMFWRNVAFTFRV
jgi:hypothetical protein